MDETREKILRWSDDSLGEREQILEFWPEGKWEDLSLQQWLLFNLTPWIVEKL